MRAVMAAITLVIVLATPALAPGAFGQVRSPRTGQQAPPMPRLWDEGLGNWGSLGLGTPGLVLAFSRLLEHSVVTVRTGAYLWSEDFSGADISATIGLPLSRGRFFASVGGGLGCMIGKLDPEAKPKAFLGLAADLQLSLRLTRRLALGLYAPVGLGVHKVIGGIFACLQYGRFEI